MLLHWFVLMRSERARPNMSIVVGGVLYLLFAHSASVCLLLSCAGCLGAIPPNCRSCVISLSDFLGGVLRDLMVVCHGSDFGDIFDVDYFISSLRDDVHIARELPEEYAARGDGEYFGLPPRSWSNETYYSNQVHYTTTHGRNSNSGSLKVQLCRLTRN